MPYFFFVWDDENDRHVAEHGITREEFEEVVCSPDRSGRSRRTGRPIAKGWTSTGKYVLCVYEELDDIRIYPVTAYEING